MFWLEAEDFRVIPGSDFMRLRARKIASQYLVERAKMKIPLSAPIREELLRGINHPTPTLFVKAQEEIYKVMEREFFPAYLESRQFNVLRMAAAHVTDNIALSKDKEQR